MIEMVERKLNVERAGVETRSPTRHMVRDIKNVTKR